MTYEFMKYGLEDLKAEEIIEYLRKSRSDDPALSVEEVLERHESILNDWVNRNLQSKVPETNIYREIVSGETIEARPEVQKVLKAIESPRIRGVLIVEPQRLSRGDLEDIGRLMKIFKYTKTLIFTPERIYDLQDKYDWESFERELKRGNEYLEYTKTILNRGRLRSVSEGNYIASVAPFGYDKTFITIGKKKCPTLKINEEQANAVRMIFDMYVNQDMGRYNICYRLDELGVKPPTGDRWSPNSLPDMLSNMVYIGKVTWNWRKTLTIVEDGDIKKTRPKQKVGDFLVYDGKHEPIISEELYNAAQEKIGRNHRTKPNTKVRNPLAGLVYCQCGRAMSLRFYKNADGSTRNAPRILCDGQSYCHTNSVTYDELISSVRDILKNSIKDFETQLSNTTQSSVVEYQTKQIKSLERRISELDEKEIKLWDEKTQARGTDNEMPEHIFKKLRDDIKAEQAELKEALEKAYATLPEPIDYEDKIIKFKDALTALDDPNVSAADKNSLLKACIQRINYSRDKAVRLTRNNCEKYGVSPEDLKTGGNWYSKPFELDVKFRI